MQLVHDRQSACIDHRAALDPPVHAKSSGEQAHPRQNAPLHSALRQFCHVAEKKKRGDRQYHRAQKEMTEETVERQVCRVLGEQLAAHDLPHGKGHIGHLQEQEADQVVAFDFLETDDDAATYRDCSRKQRAGVESFGEAVVKQGDVDRGQHGEQQHFRHGQHGEAAIEAKVGDAKLQRASDPETPEQTPRKIAPASEGDENDGSDGDSHEHGEVAIDLTSEVLANQAEGKSPEDGDKNEIRHLESFD